jgi:hypothetical protein
MSSHADFRLSLASFLPPAFICTVVGVIWSVHLVLHLMPMLQLHRSTHPEDIAQFHKGVWQTVVSQFLTLMFSICFGLSLFTAPGTVPDEEEWMMGSKGSSARLSVDLTTRELKGSTGDRRFCKWCQKYKPDRCHHCRICKQCVLKMDHHCPWIMNCVGFRNHKYFFLLVIYAVTTCAFITATMVESIQRSIFEETRASDRFMLVLGITLAIIMGGLMACFLSFHTWLLSKGMTTIEFCEKSMSSSPTTGGAFKGVSYDRGILTNVKAVFGERWWLWALPLLPAEGDGLSFETARSALVKNGLYTGEAVEPEWTGHEHRLV